MIILVVLNVDFAVHRVMNWIIRPRRGRDGRGGVEGAAGRRTEGSWEGTSLEEVVLERGGGFEFEGLYNGNEGARGREPGEGEGWRGVLGRRVDWGITVLGSLWSWEGQGLGRVRAWRG